MYDPRNEPREFVAAAREEAIEKAVRFFEMERDALAFAEMRAADVSGLGGRVLIVAVPRDRRPSPAAREARAPRERGERGGRAERGERGGRGGRGERGERGGRGERGERGGRGERGRRDRDEESRPLARAPEPSGPSVGTARGTLAPAGQFALGLIERLDFGPFEIGESEEGDLLIYEIRGEAARARAGGEGRAVDALQLLVNQVAQRDENPQRIVLDVEGNAEAREDFLTRLAERVVRRAREGGRAVALDPMSGRDRRVIHLAVREHEGVATMSIGEGRYRQVVVVPEGAPEYAEALEQSQTVRQRD